ncbi:hypothetical protein [Cesiribacter andamanensis]|uniref:Uncharacterized protein n=1 Tax=Cesiribacter andamanensis AMV16 TaxID=1279009 RepID=M7N0S1_9BACT|nr:hypothetical protein [Cesiribacter andamanensis]EMR00912.1 hypothetical protein ADICEAN_03959 [Cesiribacter andamanensis AMV16]
MNGYYTLHVLTFENQNLTAVNEYVTTIGCFVETSLVLKPFFIGTIDDARWYAKLIVSHHPWVNEVYVLKHSLQDEPERISLLKREYS